MCSNKSFQHTGPFSFTSLKAIEHFLYADYLESNLYARKSSRSVDWINFMSQHKGNYFRIIHALFLNVLSMITDIQYNEYQLFALL